MPVYEITSPDGGVYEVEAPEGATENEIMSYAQQNFGSDQAPSAEPTKEPNTIADKAGAFMTGAADMATMSFGDEVRAGLQGLIRGGLDPNVTIPEAYDFFLENYRDKQEQRQEDNPWSYGLGQVAGAMIPATAGIKGINSVAKLQKYARTKPLRTAIATGGVSGSIYGFGSGEGGAEERLQEGVYTGGLGAAAGPIGARVGQALGTALNKTGAGALLERTKRLVSKAEQPPAKPLQEIAKSSNGEVLPMTGGQLSQDPAKQAMEQAARKGAYGSHAQKILMDADNQQQTAIRNSFDELGAGTEDDLTSVGNMVRGAYKGQKAKVSQAYDKASIIDNVYVNKEPIQSTFVPQFKQTLKQFNLDDADLSDQGRRLVKEIDSIKSDKITAVNLAKMEKWRGKASNIVANNNQMKGNAAEGAAFRKAIDDYDKFMAKLPEDALKSGDEDALQAILKARGERRKQGVLFERDNIVKKIVQSQDLTDEELANMVLTGSGRAEKINSGSGRLVRNLKKAVGDRAPELQEGLKRGTLARILQRGTTTTTDGNSTLRQLSPAKLRNEFDALVKNKTFLKELFTPEEIEGINAIHRDLIKIASEQPGANNYSNTAYTLMKFVNGYVPVGKAVIGNVMEAQGNKKAANDIRKGMSDVLDGMIDELTANKRFYGAVATAPFANEGIEVTIPRTEEMTPMTREEFEAQ